MTEEVQTEAAESVPEVVSTVDPIVENIPEPEKTFTQAELDSIVTKRLAKESRKMSRQAELEVENRYLREQASKRDTKAEPSTPTQDQYSTYEEYLEAKAEYIADKKVDARMAERETKDAQSKADAERVTAQSTWQQRVDKAVEKYPDYNEVIDGVEHVMVPPVLQSAIMKTDGGADIAYHLGKNPDELERIVALEPYAALMELGKIAAKLSAVPAPVAKIVSKAPDPIKPVGGSAALNNAHAPTDDMATYIKKRNLELGRIK